MLATLFQSPGSCKVLRNVTLNPGQKSRELRRMFSGYKFFERKKFRIGEQAGLLAGIQAERVKDFSIELVYPKRLI